MTTFTAIALDRFIEPGAEKSPTVVNYSPNSKLEGRNSIVDSRQDRGINAPVSKVERGVSVPPKLVTPNPDLAKDASFQPNNAKPGKEVSFRSNAKLERGVSTPPDVKLQTGLNIPPNPGFDKRNGASTVNRSVHDKKHHWTQITPALYATPESTPLPDAPSSFPPSPYIVNHKRRGPRLMKSFSEDDVATRERVTDDENVSEEDVVTVPKDNEVCVDPEMIESIDEGVKENGFNAVKDEEGGVDIIKNSSAGDVEKSVTFNMPADDEVDDFVDPQDSVSVMSFGESEGAFAAERSLNNATPMVEFYDAWEELSTTSGPHTALPDIEIELHEVRLSLFSEIEKRKQAEETLSNMRNQWQRIREHLALMGLNLPSDPTNLPEGEEDHADPASEIFQQVYLARFVANSIGRGTARAEVESEMEAQLKLKNFEIARLWDRLHYYEAVNQEMSQRNQEVIETTRRLRQRRRRRQRWVWGSIASVISIGSAVLAYSYLKNGKGSTTSSSTDRESN